MEQPDFRPLAALLKHLSAGDIVDIRKAFDFAVLAHAPQKREDGTPYVTHVIQVAEILAGWKGDRDTIIAALLHDVLEDTPVHKDEIALKFGRKVALLVEGITKISQTDLSPDLPLDRKIETIRKLFDVMRLDMRSILIKLADRLHNVLTIDALPTPERRRRFAIETLTVYYKIAFHLGMRNARRIFAEYCVPHAFDEGAEEMKKRNTLCVSANRISESVERELRKNAEAFDLISVTMFPRNLLIFHERMKERGENPLLQDAFSLSIIVRTENDCYQLLKTLHTLFRPASGHFRDYIAAPSDAGYQSLHSVVSLNDGSTIEVRIRTPEMYEQAMMGIAMSLFDPAAPKLSSFSWLQRTEAIDLSTRDSSAAFWEALESDILKESISVNVDRMRMSLPKGSTALDAAYAIYYERASFTSMLTVNGRPVVGSEQLHEDDDVHVTLDAKHQHASFEWLQMVSTRHARFHIVDVLKRTEKSEKIALGATLLQKELDHYNKGLLSSLSRLQCQHIADEFKRQNFDQVLSMIGEGSLRARDIVFFLYPDHKRPLVSTTSDQYSFQLHISVSGLLGQEALAQLDTVVRAHNVAIRHMRVKAHSNKVSTDIHVSGSCQDRLRYADFIDQLERQEWVTTVQSLIPADKKFLLIGAFTFAFFVVCLDLVLFPVYQETLLHLSIVPRFMIQSLPILPILILNYYLLRLLRTYVVRMRSELWYLGIGLLLNVVGLLLLLLRILLISEEKASLLPLITIFVLSLVYMGYRFFEADALFAPFARRTKSLSEQEWIAIKKRKTFGYSIRILAVIIWGIEPIYIRYTPANSLSPFIRIFLLGFGVLMVSAVTLLIQQAMSGKNRVPLLQRMKIPHEKFFLCLVVGQIGFMYLKNASLVYTTGTNLLLFNNFAPLLGLLVAAALWRREIPYLKQPKTMLSIFLLAVVAGLGSSLLVHSNSVTGATSIFGDILAFIAALFDVLLVVSQIQYIKNFGKTDPAVLNIHVFFYLLLFVSPVIIAAAIFHWAIFANLSLKAILLGIGIGLFEGVGQMCNYAAFKRIDGYLAHMMFNLSVFITFSIEAFVIHSVQPTLLLLLSGIIIIGASLTAETINSRCQKKGL